MWKAAREVSRDRLQAAQAALEAAALAASLAEAEADTLAVQAVVTVLASMVAEAGVHGGPAVKRIPRCCCRRHWVVMAVGRRWRQGSKMA